MKHTEGFYSSERLYAERCVQGRGRMRISHILSKREVIVISLLIKIKIQFCNLIYYVSGKEGRDCEIKNLLFCDETDRKTEAKGVNYLKN